MLSFSPRLAVDRQIDARRSNNERRSSDQTANVDLMIAR